MPATRARCLLWLVVVNLMNPLTVEQIAVAEFLAAVPNLASAVPDTRMQALFILAFQVGFREGQRTAVERVAAPSRQ